jgi:hypothetical protein
MSDATSIRLSHFFVKRPLLTPVVTVEIRAEDRATASLERCRTLLDKAMDALYLMASAGVSAAQAAEGLCRALGGPTRRGLRYTIHWTDDPLAPRNWLEHALYRVLDGIWRSP